MLEEILNPIRHELLLVQEKLNKHFNFRSGHLEKFVHLPGGAVARWLRPAVTLLSARLFGPVSEKVLSLAGVVQFIFLAGAVHRQVMEEEKEEENERCRFLVLVGDYLYGRFFTTLCEAGIVCYLRPLAEIICGINEANVLRLKSDMSSWHDEVYLEAIRKETAELLAGGCRLGASLAGCNREEQELLYRFGLNLGMALGLVEWNQQWPVLSQQRLEFYLHSFGYEARSVLAQLPSHPARYLLEKIVNYVLSYTLPVAAVVSAGCEAG